MSTGLPFRRSSPEGSNLLPGRRSVWRCPFDCNQGGVSVMNRWLAVVGGVSMNLALGSLYAWSVFVIPLEHEFGWTRAQPSWVFPIAIVAFAISFVVAGRFQDVKGPRVCALTGAIMVGLGFALMANPRPTQIRRAQG